MLLPAAIDDFFWTAYNSKKYISFHLMYNTHLQFNKCRARDKEERYLQIKIFTQKSQIEISQILFKPTNKKYL